MENNLGQGNISVQVVVLAAGKGSRMRSQLPKVLHPLGGRPLIGQVLAAAASLRPRLCAVVLGHAYDQVAASLAELSLKLDLKTVLVRQGSTPGTGGALYCALPALEATTTTPSAGEAASENSSTNSTVVVLCGDVPLVPPELLAQLVAEHRRSQVAATLITGTVENPAGYGRILRAASPGSPVLGIVEEVAATPEQRELREINTGVYVFRLDALAQALRKLARNQEEARADKQAGQQEEMYVTDVIALLVAAGEKVASIAAPQPELLLGVNDRAQLSEAAATLNRQLIRAHQQAGVTVQDPGSTWIDLDVRLGEDVTLLPGTILQGETTVGRGATIGPDTLLKDCWVGVEAQICRTHGQKAHIGAQSSVGPYAYLRPGSHLEPGAKVGAYVEIKNSRLGAGAKIPHLTYVGDADIGAEANVGAGTVFANYDGKEKHRSMVEAEANLGAGTILVAPVTVGAGAYTGAGTTVRNDVPAAALVLSVAEEKIIPHWADRRAETNRAGTASANKKKRKSD